MSKFQSNRTRSFVLTACGNRRVRGFYKKGKGAILGGDSIFLEGRWRSETKERSDSVYGDCSPSMATIKIGLKSFDVIARRFLMSHAQVS